MVNDKLKKKILYYYQFNIIININTFYYVKANELCFIKLKIKLKHTCKHINLNNE